MEEIDFGSEKFSSRVWFELNKDSFSIQTLEKFKYTLENDLGGLDKELVEVIEGNQPQFIKFSTLLKRVENDIEDIKLPIQQVNERCKLGDQEIKILLDKENHLVKQREDIILKKRKLLRLIKAREMFDWIESEFKLIQIPESVVKKETDLNALMDNFVNFLLAIGRCVRLGTYTKIQFFDPEDNTTTFGHDLIKIQDYLLGRIVVRGEAGSGPYLGLILVLQLELMNSDKARVMLCSNSLQSVHLKKKYVSAIRSNLFQA